MKKNNIIFIGVGIIIVVLAIFFLMKGNKSLDQVVYTNTISLSKEYLRLRYVTDNVLVNAEQYKDYDTWNNEMTNIIKGWNDFEKDAIKLEKDADKLAIEKVAFNFVQNVNAYDSKEVQYVIENAPAGKTIRTLAKHFNVDVKKAQLILNESQDRIQREVWGNEGDTFESLEQDAMRVKNGCKVAGFVGGVVLTGGTSAVMASGVLAKTALVVGGADLVLEITADEAQIALGDKNKVSEMVGKLRTVTEPAASILTLVNIPGNVSKAMEKINAVSFGVDQIRSVIQDEKVLGISIKIDEKGEIKAEATSLTETELPAWKKENNIENSTETINEILELKEVTQTEEKEESKEEETKTEEPTKKGTISYDEWDDWGDADSRYKEDLLDKFGNPDVTQAKSGKEVWVYYDLAYYTSGNTCSVVYTFYSTNQTATRRCLSRDNVKVVLENN